MTPRRPSKISDEQLLAAVPHAQSLRQLLLAVGVAAYGGNYEVIRARLAALGVDEPRFARRPRQAASRQASPEELRRAVSIGDSYAQVARLLGWGNSSWVQGRVKKLIQEAQLDTGHFLGRSAMRGLNGNGRPAQSWETLLVRGRPTTTSRLRERLLEAGLLLPECVSCAGVEWQGRPIPLELDHINGDRTDNRLENLRLLCPNCHAQTDTYRGRNIGRPARMPEPEPEPERETPGTAARRRLALLLRSPAPYRDATPP